MCARVVAVLQVLTFSALRLSVAAAPSPGDAFDEDADKDALARLRQRLEKHQLGARLGVVLFTSKSAWAHAQLSVPIWKAYCDKHGFDFFVQNEPLVVGIRDDWSKPKLMIELLRRAKWKYALYVEPDSVPAGFNKSWEYAITEHMRHRRFRNDEANKRVVFCPWDCEKEYEDQLAEGACYGPLLSGCIWQFKGKRALKLARGWYEQRKKGDPSSGTAVKKGLEAVKQGKDWEAMFWRDVQSEIGRPDSSLIATFAYDEKHGWDIRRQLEAFLKQRMFLGEIVNQAVKAAEKSDL